MSSLSLIDDQNRECVRGPPTVLRVIRCLRFAPPGSGQPVRTTLADMMSRERRPIVSSGPRSSVLLYVDVYTHINEYLRKVRRPQPLRRVVGSAKFGNWHPSTTLKIFLVVRIVTQSRSLDFTRSAFIAYSRRWPGGLTYIQRMCTKSACSTTRASTSVGIRVQPATVRPLAPEGDITYVRDARKRGSNATKASSGKVGGLGAQINHLQRTVFRRKFAVGVTVMQPQRGRTNKNLGKTTKNEKRNFDSLVEHSRPLPH